MEKEGRLPGLLDNFDGIEIIALIVLLSTMAFVAFGSLSFSSQIVQMVIFASLATLFGTKAVKGGRR